MRNVFIISSIALLLIFSAGCTKTNPTVFSWYYLGNNYVADSAYSPATTAGIANSLMIAYYAQTYILGFNTNTTLKVGSYSLGTNSTSDFAFFFTPQEIFSQTGQLNITYNNGKSMSGNFTITFTDGSVMTGSFSDIPIR